MKKVILLFFLILFPLNVKASICVMDTDTKRLLSGYGEEEVRLIASTTKIMTSLVVINNVDDLNKEIEVTDDVLKSFGSGIYIEVGEHIKIIDLLYGLILRSGNDAAIMLATYVGGSMEGFASLMNETAKSIGMKNTKFINSSGLENDKGEGNTSTCYDMAILMSEAVKNETLTKIMSTKHYGVQTDYKYYDWYNKNKLLSEYKYTTGGKTGFTEIARRTLVSTASKDNMNLVVVTLNDGNDFADHKNLFEYAFNNYKSYQILEKGIIQIYDDSYYNKYNLYIKNDFKYLLSSNENESILLDFELEKNRNIQSGDKVGKVDVLLGDKIIHTEDIYVKEKREQARNWWQKIKAWFHDS